MQSKVNRKIEAELLGMADAEAMTGRSRWSWRRDCYSGIVASVKIGRRLFVPIALSGARNCPKTYPLWDGRGVRPVVSENPFSGKFSCAVRCLFGVLQVLPITQLELELALRQ